METKKIIDKLIAEARESQKLLKQSERNIHLTLEEMRRTANDILQILWKDVSKTIRIKNLGDGAFSCGCHTKEWDPTGYLYMVDEHDNQVLFNKGKVYSCRVEEGAVTYRFYEMDEKITPADLDLFLDAMKKNTGIIFCTTIPSYILDEFTKQWDCNEIDIGKRELKPGWTVEEEEGVDHY